MKPSDNFTNFRHTRLVILQKLFYPQPNQPRRNSSDRTYAESNEIKEPKYRTLVYYLQVIYLFVILLQFISAICDFIKEFPEIELLKIVKITQGTELFIVQPC